MNEAVIIPGYRLGRRAPSNRPALHLSQFLTGVVPAHPVTADHLGTVEYGMYGNDKYGVCGPTSVANLRRLVTAGLTGTMVAPTQDDVFDLYRRSGNSNFDPNDPGGPGDGGVDMQTMLEALVAGGVGGVKPLCFAKLDVGNDDELTAAVSIFGGLLWGVDLEMSQQDQTKAGQWDWVEAPQWGGHAVLEGAFEPQALEDVITWAKRVKTTDAFRRHQLQEGWVVIWQENVDHPAFQAGVDLTQLAADYQALTGKTLPVAPPAPNPTPPDPTPPPSPTAGSTFQVSLTPDTASKVTAYASQEGVTPEGWIANLVEKSQS